MAVPGRNVVTEAEYLELEDAQELKHELVNGEIVAMSGCSEAHATVTMNLLELLLGGLKGEPCRPLSSDFRVCIDETGLYAYPAGLPVWGGHHRRARRHAAAR